MLLQMGPLLHLGPVITLVPSTSQIPTCNTNDERLVALKSTHLDYIYITQQQQSKYKGK